MADLISRAAAIDAIVSVTAFPDDEYIKNLCQNPANSEDWLGGVCDAINAIEDMNAVDAVHVVRCRDCKYWGTPFDKNDTGFMVAHCEHFDESHAFSEQFYCASGERRDDDAAD